MASFCFEIGLMRHAKRKQKKRTPSMTASHQPVVAHPHSWRSPWQQFTTIHTSHGFYLFKMMYQCDHSPKNGMCMDLWIFVHTSHFLH